MTTKRKKVSGDARIRTPFTPSHLVFGGIFVGVGIFLGWANLAFPDHFTEAPPFLMPLFGGIFALSGLSLIGQNVWAWAEARRVPQGREPWHLDYRWHREGITDGNGRNLLVTFGKLLFFALFMLPFHLFIWSFGDDAPVWIFYAAIGLFDLILFLIFCHWVYNVVQWLRFGDKKLRYRAFPYFPGEILRARFEGGHELARCDVKATLRCVENVIETVSEDGKTTTRTNVHKLWSQDIEARADALGYAELAFLIPDDAEPTSLRPGAPRCIYWEVVVRVAVPGVDYDGTFLVPVYACTAQARPVVTMAQAAS